MVSGIELVSLSVSIVSLGVSAIAAHYARGQAELAQDALLLGAFNKALEESGTVEEGSFEDKLTRTFQNTCLETIGRMKEKKSHCG